MLKILKRYKDMPITAKVSIAYAVCSILQKCLSFITLPLFTRLLTTEQYGQYNVYTSWSAIITIFVTLNLAYGSFSKAMVKFEDDRDAYIASIQGISTVLGVAFLLIYFPFRKYLNKLFELPTELVILMVAEIVMLNAILCWNGKKRFEFKYKGVVAITLLMSVISPVLAYFMVVNSEEKGYARIVGYAAITIFVGLVLYIVNLLKGKSFINKTYWKYALGFNVPLIVYYLSQVIFNQSDRIMISHMVGTDKAGIYGVAYSLAIILNFVLNSINNSYQPWFYGKIKAGEEHENKKISNGIAVLMGILLLGIIAMAPEIILIMAGKKYAEAVWIVPPVAGSILLLLYSQYCINIEFYYEKKKKLVYASIAAAILNILLNAMLIPVFGYIVAGYTTWISYIVFVLMNYIEMLKILKEDNKEQNIYDVRFLLTFFALFTLASIIFLVFYKLYIIRYALVLLFGLICFLCRKRLLKVYNSILKK
ncbi:MAG: polysaccharide biosynthesis protein [Lachnospiraceae bacterium]|nr:polysaccharide biosynthesis protein [Lachnospiraceae bacterium]